MKKRPEIAKIIVQNKIVECICGGKVVTVKHDPPHRKNVRYVRLFA
jgi:hypothetical protein